eukprot:CAMPEP_0115334610 /NCGR_PEP_ID=MMETSP0270-20121206/87999_1 /TAXON_ID=71861 /ORGANISM="Scrippsiella trochoidea, Strain CCMP3099" /LENGTH=190 /DNA_ID=CAMNT_0002755597 /DNA_START=233 /DNA_END=806 /DNA_ORIENTATION=-
MKVLNSTSSHVFIFLTFDLSSAGYQPYDWLHVGGKPRAPFAVDGSEDKLADLCMSPSIGVGWKGPRSCCAKAASAAYSQPSRMDLQRPPTFSICHGPRSWPPRVSLPPLVPVPGREPCEDLSRWPPLLDGGGAAEESPVPGRLGAGEAAAVVPAARWGADALCCWGARAAMAAASAVADGPISGLWWSWQ